VTAVAGSDVDAGNDGYYLVGTVFGHLYIDTNGDGNQDGGEPDLADVDVVITDSNGVTQTVTTDANGDWSATVPPGSTTADVDESDPEYPVGYTQTEGTDPTTVTAVAGSDVDAGNDGYYLPLVQYVEGTVYIDEDGDGQFNSLLDTPLPGVDVVITDSNCVTQTVTTDASGYFSQTVPAGSTEVNVDDNDLPVGVTLTDDSFGEGNDPTTVVVPAGGTATDNTGYIAAVPELHLDKRVSPAGVVNPGDILTYTLCYSNSGSIATTNVVITDYIPANTVYVASSVTAPNGEQTRFYDGSAWGPWGGLEPATVLGLGWSRANLPANSTTYCVEFTVQISPVITISGMAFELTDWGWALAGSLAIPIPTLTPMVTLTPTAPTVTVTATLTGEATALPTPTPTATEVPTEGPPPEATPTATATELPTEEPTVAETSVPVPTETGTPTSVPIEVATEEPTATEVPIESLTEEPAAEPEATDTVTPTPTGESEVTSEATSSSLFLAARSWLGSIISLSEPLLSVGAIPLAQEASPTPTEAPTATPTEVPTEAPTEEPMPTGTPTEVPTEVPTEEATATAIPTEALTREVTATLTATPTPVESPTAGPMETASPAPTASATATSMASPTMAISPTATIAVTAGPAGLPTATPTVTTVPIITPTVSIIPTVEPLLAASELPISAMEVIEASIVNTATMTSDQTEELTSSVTNPLIGTVDPQITKQGDPAQAQIGDIVTFTLWVSNTGNVNATGVTVRDDIANYLDILSVAYTKGTLVSPPPAGLVVVDIGTLAPGELVSITIRTQVNDNAAPPPVNIINEANLEFEQGVPRDSERVVVRVPGGGGGGGDDDDDDDGPPPPAPTPTPFATVPVTSTPTPEVMAVSTLPETGGRPSLLPSFPGLSLITMIAVLVLLVLLRREGRKSDN
jgi:uncharacterized repeat protein (TIGR01451 family)